MEYLAPIIMTIIILFAIFFLLYAIYEFIEEGINESYRHYDKYIPTYRVIEKKLLNGETIYQIQYKLLIKWRNLYHGEYSLESAKSQIEERLKEELENYSRNTSVKETIVLQSKRTQLK